MREGSVDQSSINEQNCTQIVKGIRYTLLKTITKGKNAVSENLHVIQFYLETVCLLFTGKGYLYKYTVIYYVYGSDYLSGGTVSIGEEC